MEDKLKFLKMFEVDKLSCRLSNDVSGVLFEKYHFKASKSALAVYVANIMRITVVITCI